MSTSFEKSRHPDHSSGGGGGGWVNPYCQHDHKIKLFLRVPFNTVEDFETTFATVEG